MEGFSVGFFGRLLKVFFVCLKLHLFLKFLLLLLVLFVVVVCCCCCCCCCCCSLLPFFFFFKLDHLPSNVGMKITSNYLDLHRSLQNQPFSRFYLNDSLRTAVNALEYFLLSITLTILLFRHRLCFHPTTPPTKCVGHLFLVLCSVCKPVSLRNK